MGGRDVEVVLQSLTNPSHRVVLSKDWPAASVEFLKHSDATTGKKSNPAPSAKTRGKKTTIRVNRGRRMHKDLRKAF